MQNARLKLPSGEVSRSAFQQCRSYIVGKGKKTKTGVYHPPKSGMPYSVVTVSPEGVTATACGSKEEARILASKKTMKVFVEEEMANEQIKPL
jgi:hypothetical protein